MAKAKINRLAKKTDGVAYLSASFENKKLNPNKKFDRNAAPVAKSSRLNDC